MSPEERIPTYLQPYQDAVDSYGGTFEATLWRSKEGQRLRFSCFTNDIDFTGKSIIDVGCGIGDFGAFLIDSKISFKSYLGLDAMEPMIETAKNRKLEHCNFTVGDAFTSDCCVQKTDWSIFSGTLNAMSQQDAMELIRSSFQSSIVGVGFNFLSDQCWRNVSSEDLRPASRFHTMELLHFAFSLTPLVSFNQSYLQGHDATIVIRKQEVSQ